MAEKLTKFEKIVLQLIQSDPFGEIGCYNQKELIKKRKDWIHKKIGLANFILEEFKKVEKS